MGKKVSDQKKFKKSFLFSIMILAIICAVEMISLYVISVYLFDDISVLGDPAEYLAWIIIVSWIIFEKKIQYFIYEKILNGNFIEE